MTRVTEENKEIVRRWLKALNERDLEAAQVFIDTERCVVHEPDGESFRPIDRRGGWAQAFAAFPDMQYEVHELVAEGDLVVAHILASGTHSGAASAVSWGIAPKNARLKISEVIVVRLDGRKIVEEWHSYDRLAYLLQLAPTQEEMRDVIHRMKQGLPFT